MTIAFIITSVINTSSHNWTYAQRSAFTPEQRFNQSIGTIESIKRKVPDAHIYFIEGSKLSDEMHTIISGKVTQLVYDYEGDENISAISNSPYKGHGEAKQTLDAIAAIINSEIKYDYIFKLSGRYQLSDTFDYKRFLNKDPTFCQGKDESKSGSYSTVVYSIPWDLIPTWEKALFDFMDYCKRYASTGGANAPFYENMMPRGFDKIYGIHKCGTHGFVAVASNDFFNCS
jgi:hypothetical protein